MTRTSDGPEGSANDGPIEPIAPRTGIQPHILVVEEDRALLGLLEEWLGSSGCVVESEDNPDGALQRKRRYDVVIVDLPHPRRAGSELLQRLARELPDVPIIALSSTFFPRIESTGGVARTLGVACVLPKPVARESLLAAVRSLLRR